jgi:hypothetical protein
MDNQKQTTVVHVEGSPWFWKLFGGAIISITTLLLAVILNNFNNNIVVLRQDCTASMGKIQEEFAVIKEKMAAQATALSERSAASEKYADIMRINDSEHTKQLIEVRERLLHLEDKVSKVETRP